MVGQGVEREGDKGFKQSGSNNQVWVRRICGLEWGSTR